MGAKGAGREEGRCQLARVEKGGKQRHLGGVSRPALMVNNDTPDPDDHRHYQPSVRSPARKRLILFNYAALQSRGSGGKNDAGLGG